MKSPIDGVAGGEREAAPSEGMVYLSQFELGDYDAGRPLWVRMAWYFVGMPLVRSYLLPLSSVKRAVLRGFGARIGRGVIIRPGVRVKNPWLLEVGDHCMIGEDAWIDNLVPVRLGANVCLSQGCYLCTGNHDWSSPSFRYRLGAITVEDGGWVGAKALVGPGVTVGKCGIVAAGGVATKAVGPYEIHAGNPAKLSGVRRFRADSAMSGESRKASLRW